MYASARSTHVGAIFGDDDATQDNTGNGLVADVSAPVNHVLCHVKGCKETDKFFIENCRTCCKDVCYAHLHHDVETNTHAFPLTAPARKDYLSAALRAVSAPEDQCPLSPPIMTLNVIPPIRMGSRRDDMMEDDEEEDNAPIRLRSYQMIQNEEENNSVANVNRAMLADNDDDAGRRANNALVPAVGKALRRTTAEVKQSKEEDAKKKFFKLQQELTSAEEELEKAPSAAKKAAK